jgi:mRNA interferase MazF
VLLNARSAGLPRDSVANVSQIVAIDRALLSERFGRLSARQLDLILAGMDIALGR